MLLLCRLESTTFDYTPHLGKDGLAEKINEVRAVLRTPVPLLEVYTDQHVYNSAFSMKLRSKLHHLSTLRPLSTQASSYSL
jgi:hypothetical protein